MKSGRASNNVRARIGGVVSTLERGREEVSRGKTLIDGPQIESRQALKSTRRPPETVGATFSLSTAVSAEAAAPAARMTILASRYTIELFKPGGEGAGVEAIIDRDDLFNFARALSPRRHEASRKVGDAVRARSHPSAVRSAGNDAALATLPTVLHFFEPAARSKHSNRAALSTIAVHRRGGLLRSEPGVRAAAN
jgi:hypothetical protein